MSAENWECILFSPDLLVNCWMNLKFVFVFAVGLLSSVQMAVADDFEEYDRELPLEYERIRVDVEQDFRNETYSIDSSVDELGEVLLDRAPSSGSGLKSLSRLILDVDWQISAEQRAHMCYLHGVKIINKTIFTVPYWDAPGDVSEADMEKWDSFIESVNAYQNENRKIINKHLDSFKRDLETVRPVRLCDELKKNINDLGMSHLQNAANEISAIAQETNYGKDFKNLDYPDFYSDRPELPAEQIAEDKKDDRKNGDRGDKPADRKNDKKNDKKNGSARGKK